MSKKIQRAAKPAPKKIPRSSAVRAPRKKTPAPEAGALVRDEHKGAIALRPEILAPAGDMPSALAGLAAGADALYLGLKHFSARMQAENFSTSELASLADLAHDKGRRIYVAMNTLVKPGEPAQAFRLIKRLALNVRPDALIIQDAAMPDLARQAGFEGELHFSTLANVTHQKALEAVKGLGASRAILPRELSFDEVRLMNDACPQDLTLEFFVHGALCYCVSGRCWWSGYMGGKSGLRGRCVQPCRRVYTQKGREGRFFSCRDFSLDNVTRDLLGLDKVVSWKIEGRKKGPHYVYHATAAYCLLRDDPDNPEARREAARLLEMALGRPGTRSRFISAKAESPAAPPATGESQTSSGLLCGAARQNAEGRYEIRPRIDLMPKDILRVGYEDEAWHVTFSLPRNVPKGAALVLPLPGNKRPKPGTPVFLIDRKDAALTALLADWNRLLRKPKSTGKAEDLGSLEPAMPRPLPPGSRGKRLDILLRASLPHGREAKTGIKPGTVRGLWLSPSALREVSRTLFGRISWWLPPVIWPDEEDLWSRLIKTVLQGGARHLVLNAPWQTALFADPGSLSLCAGPFCNTANAPALETLRRMGFSSAVISPELGEKDILDLPGQSPLPLGITLSGYWPVGITRHKADPLKSRDPFSSPKGEQFWMRRYGQNLWLYPAWPLDISAHRPALERAGYTTFIHMDEHPPQSLERPDRPGEFNWNVGML